MDEEKITNSIYFDREMLRENKRCAKGKEKRLQTKFNMTTRCSYCNSNEI